MFAAHGARSGFTRDLIAIAGRLTDGEASISRETGVQRESNADGSRVDLTVDGRSEHRRGFT
jgi:hypothetical protein